MNKPTILRYNWIRILILASYLIIIGANEKKIICYLNNNSLDSNSNLKFYFNKIDPHLCTHFVYSFATIHEENLIPSNMAIDINFGGYLNFTKLKLKNPELKLIILIGESESDISQFSILLRNVRARISFIHNIIKFLKEHNFDGIELAWPKPGSEYGNRLDKRNYVRFLKEIRKLFTDNAIRNKHDPFLVSIALPYNIDDAKQGFDVIRLNRLVDWFNLINYDSLHLFSVSKSYMENNNPIDYFIKAGASPEKIVLGISTYGLLLTVDSSFKISHTNTKLLEDPYKIFELSKKVDTIPFLRICENLKNISDWKIFKKQFGTFKRNFALNKNEVILFKDDMVVREIAEQVNHMNLSGISFWTIDQEDFIGLCSDEPYPLIHAAKQILRNDFSFESRISSSQSPLISSRFLEDEARYDFSFESRISSSQSPIISSRFLGDEARYDFSFESRISSSQSPIISSRFLEDEAPENLLEKENISDRIVCYTTNWSIYRAGLAKFDQYRIDPDLCTHIIYSYAKVNEENVEYGDRTSDITLGGYANCLKLRSLNENLKLLIGLRVIDNEFSKTIADLKKRKIFINNVFKHIQQHGFDGMDLVWKYPALEDKVNFVQLITEMRNKIAEENTGNNGNKSFLISITIPANIKYAKNGYDLQKLNKLVDWFNLLSYDYHISNESNVNHHAPLYEIDGTSNENLNVDASVNYYLYAGIQRTRLVVGIPTFGVSFLLKNPENSYIGAPSSGPGLHGKYTNNPGTISYFEICEILQSTSNWKIMTPFAGKVGPYAVNEKQWIAYDDEAMVEIKAEYVAKRGLGGIMFWTIDQDDFRGICGSGLNVLIQTAKSAYLSKLKQYELDQNFKNYFIQQLTSSG